MQMFLMIKHVLWYGSMAKRTEKDKQFQLRIQVPSRCTSEIGDALRGIVAARGRQPEVITIANSLVASRTSTKKILLKSFKYSKTYKQGIAPLRGSCVLQDNCVETWCPKKVRKFFPLSESLRVPFFNCALSKCLIHPRTSSLFAINNEHHYPHPLEKQYIIHPRASSSFAIDKNVITPLHPKTINIASSCLTNIIFHGRFKQQRTSSSPPPHPPFQDNQENKKTSCLPASSFVAINNERHHPSPPHPTPLPPPQSSTASLRPHKQKMTRKNKFQTSLKRG